MAGSSGRVGTGNDRRVVAPRGAGLALPPYGVLFAEVR